MPATWKHRRALIEPRAIGPIGLVHALVFQVMLAVLGLQSVVTAVSGTRRPRQKLRRIGRTGHGIDVEIA